MRSNICGINGIYNIYIYVYMYVFILIKVILIKFLFYSHHAISVEQFFLSPFPVFIIFLVLFFIYFFFFCSLYDLVLLVISSSDWLNNVVYHFVSTHLIFIVYNIRPSDIFSHMLYALILFVIYFLFFFFFYT